MGMRRRRAAHGAAPPDRAAMPSRPPTGSCWPCRRRRLDGLYRELRGAPGRRASGAPRRRLRGAPAGPRRGHRRRAGRGGAVSRAASPRPGSGAAVACVASSRCATGALPPRRAPRAVAERRSPGGGRVLVGEGRGGRRRAAGVAADVVAARRPARSRPGAGPRGWPPLAGRRGRDRAAGLARRARPGAAAGGRACGRPLVAGAVGVEPARRPRSPWDGGPRSRTSTARRPASSPPCSRACAGVEPATGGATPWSRTVGFAARPCRRGRRRGRDAELLEVLPPDPATMDLAEARRIVAGGAASAGPRPSPCSPRSATALGASLGATRVVTDSGWVAHERQIGTTGVIVDPRAVRGLRHLRRRPARRPASAIPTTSSSVNIDPSCPMMAWPTWPSSPTRRRRSWLAGCSPRGWRRSPDAAVTPARSAS